MRPGREHHEMPSSQRAVPTTRPAGLGLSPLQPWNLHVSARGELGPGKPDTEPVGSVGGGGDSWGRSQGSQGPAARTLGKARAGGLPGLCYLLSVSRPARHFLTALSTGRGQGPSPPSKGSQRRAWRPGAGRLGWGWGVRGRGVALASCRLVPGQGPQTQAGAARAPQAHPKARRQQDAAWGRISLCAPLPCSLAPSYCSPLLPA